MQPPTKTLTRNFPLKDLNTFRIDVRATEFGAFTDIRALQELMSQVTREPLILGGGSNILPVDDVDRSVLLNQISGIEIVEEHGTEVTVRIGAGMHWHACVSWAVGQDLGGLENLALIPGTVGAAPLQNIGAYGVELKDVFHALEAVHLESGKLEVFDLTDCRFGYRDSVFKQELTGQYCVVAVFLRLGKTPHHLHTEYGAIRNVLEERGIKHPTISDIFHAVIEIRSSKLPDPAVIGNAGSFFKNPVVSAEQFFSIRGSHPEVPAYPAGENQYKIPAGWLIEKCGWKGKRFGQVGCYEKQALVIVNYGNASGREVYDHALRVRQSVSENFGIELIPEVNLI